MRLLGEKTGAFEPAISNEIAQFLPENIRRFDAIVMNNSCGPWITPSDAAMEKLKSYADELKNELKAVEEKIKEMQSLTRASPS